MLKGKLKKSIVKNSLKFSNIISYMQWLVRNNNEDLVENLL